MSARHYKLCLDNKISVLGTYKCFRFYPYQEVMFWMCSFFVCMLSVCVCNNSKTKEWIFLECLMCVGLTKGKNYEIFGKDLVQVQNIKA